MVQGVSDVKEFRPHTGVKKGNILGLVTGDGALYAIGLEAAGSVELPNPWRKSQQWMDILKKLGTPMKSLPQKYKAKREAKAWAAKEKVKIVNIYPSPGGPHYKIVEISKEIDKQAFPA
jgi:hypothetical protein